MTRTVFADCQATAFTGCAAPRRDPYYLMTYGTVHTLKAKSWKVSLLASFPQSPRQFPYATLSTLSEHRV